MTFALAIILQALSNLLNSKYYKTGYLHLSISNTAQILHWSLPILHLALKPTHIAYHSIDPITSQGMRRTTPHDTSRHRHLTRNDVTMMADYPHHPHLMTHADNSCSTLITADPTLLMAADADADRRTSCTCEHVASANCKWGHAETTSGLELSTPYQHAQRRQVRYDTLGNKVNTTSQRCWEFSNSIILTKLFWQKF